jgi:hypothetical protein
MERISISTPGFVRSLCLAAAAAFALSAVPIERAAAMSPVNPGTAPSAQSTTDDLMIQVRGGHGGFGGGGGHGLGGGHMGGGHISGGHYGGARFGGGGWHGARVAHFGGYRYGGFRHYGGHRFAHFHHRRFYGGYYPYYPYYHHHRCRIVWTYYGPRRVCHWHRWHRWHRYY